MFKFNLIVLMFLSFSSLADEDMSIWEFPVLGSDNIGNNCSDETNKVMMRLTLSEAGEIKNSVFLKKSTIDKVNDEAKKNIMALSPFEEFESMTASEAKKYNKVIMSYTIPCKHM